VSENKKPVKIPPKFNPDEPLTAAAERVLKEHVRALVKNETGTKKDTDIEYLHRMRVAVNRLRVAVMLFWHCYPKKRITFLRDELRWLAGSLGMVRDYDVTIERLDGIRKEAPDEVKQGYDIFIAEVLAERDARFAKLLKTLESKRYNKLKDALLKTAGLYKKPVVIKEPAPAETEKAEELSADIIQEKTPPLETEAAATSDPQPERKAVEKPPEYEARLPEVDGGETENV
jgi:CHAD domain-containing protein